MQTTIIPKQEKIIEIFTDKQIAYVALFGSRAKESAQDNSDYDFLVEFSPMKKYSILDIVSLKNDLRNILGSEVDLITTKGINPKLEKEILSSKKVIYDRR